MKKFIPTLLTAMLLTSCMNNTQKKLILYYSQTGATEKIAIELQAQTGADIERFDVEQVYDGDFMATVERTKKERENGFIPTLCKIKSDISKYDVIFLAYPIWFGTYAPPVKALLAAHNFEGKKIVPVCTFGSGGLESSIEDLKNDLPLCDIASGFGIRNARIQYAGEELNRFLIENGYKEGSVEPLGEYSAQREAMPEELAIYKEATDGYPFPIGEPVSVGSRPVSEGTDYLFIVRTTSPNGVVSKGKVFVSFREGRPAEFTNVIR